MLNTRYRTLVNQDTRDNHRAFNIEYRFLLAAFCLLIFFASIGISIEQQDPNNLSTSYPMESLQDANMPDALTAKKLSQTSLYIAPKPSSKVMRQLQQNNISVPKSREGERKKTELQHLIKQIRAIRFESKSQIQEPVITVEPVPTTELNETLSVTEAAHQPVEKEEMGIKSDSQMLYEPVSDETLRMLENLSQHPDRLRNPLGMAEILFLSGHLKQATVFYQQALNRMDPNDVNSSQEKAWILFQIGNCLRDDDLLTAKKMYRQLIVECPNCPWIDLAKSRERLIDWFLTEKPRKLIAE